MKKLSLKQQVELLEKRIKDLELKSLIGGCCQHCYQQPYQPTCPQPQPYNPIYPNYPGTSPYPQTGPYCQ